MINKRNLLVVALCVLATGAFARAQDEQKQNVQPAMQSIVADGNPTPSLSAAAQPAKAVSNTGVFGGVAQLTNKQKEEARISAKYRKFAAQDWHSVPFPGMGDTVDPEFGGIREALAKHDMGIFVMPYLTFYDNLLNPPMYGAAGAQCATTVGGVTTYPLCNPNTPGAKYYDDTKINKPGTSLYLYNQAFAGQRPTFKGSVSTWLTFNNFKTGTQFVLGANENYNNYTRGSGVTDVRMGAIYLNQWLLHKKLNIAIGYFPSGYNTVGMYVGGNFAGSLQGVVAILPTLVGQNTPYAITPNSVITYYGPKNLYAIGGIQRSLSPEAVVSHGVSQTSDWHDALWLPFRLVGDKNTYGYHPYEAKAYAQLELGYKRNIAPGSKQIWNRLDGFYNWTRYADNRLNALGHAQSNVYTKNNFCISDGFDMQLNQPDRLLPFRGLYAGTTLQYAPPQQNSYTQYYEFRAYYKGLFKSRPYDMTQFMTSNLQTSKIYIRHAFLTSSAAYHSASDTNQNISFAWVAKLTSGIWVNVGAEYALHPTAIPTTPNVLVGTSTLQIYL
jgi:porin